MMERRTFRAMLTGIVVAPFDAEAKQATRTLPIVFIGPADPVTDGLVTSLARPGGNVTGVSSGASDQGIESRWGFQDL